MGTAYIVDAVRTPVGRKNGALSKLHAVELGAVPLRALLQRTGLDPAAIEDVVYGNVTPVGEQGLNVGRMCALEAGFPVTTTGVQVNRMCGSSQQAIHFAAMGVASGFQDLVVAGGVESMSRVPMGSDMFLNGEMAALPSEIGWKYSIIPQGKSAELIARRWGLTRAALDAYALRSHERAARATDAGWQAAEIVPVEVGGQVLLATDEGIRRDTTMARLASLKPAFQEDGVITAASSSQISDGAGAVLLASEAAVARYGLRPRARIVSIATAGVDPTIMLTGPIPAAQSALAKAGLSLADLATIEINEAFASVVLAFCRELGVDDAVVNPFGGAIANGHPLGASGAKLMTTMLNYLDRTGGRYGLQTMCIGFGQATATVVERLDR
jgi:acetyl-CoA acyltransferase